METSDTEATIEPGMKVAVRRGVSEHIGVVLRVEGEHVFVRWTLSEWRELEFRAPRSDVTVLPPGWI